MVDYEKEAKAYPIQFIEKNENAYFSLIFWTKKPINQKLILKDTRKSYENLNSSIKDSPKGLK